MKKQISQLAVLTAVLVALVLTLVLVWQPAAEPPQFEAEESAGEEAVLLYDMAGVVSVAVSQPGREVYTLVLEEDADGEVTGSLLGMEDLPVYGSKIQNAMADCAALEAISLVLENPGNPAEFGFDNPVEVIVTGMEGESHTLEIGGQAPAGDGYYLRLDGGEAVYLLSNSVATRFLGEYTTYLTTQITPGSYAQFYELTLGGTVREELGAVVVRGPQGESSEDVTDYRLVGPVERALSSSDGLQAISSLFGLQALDVMLVYPDPEELESFGLSEPYYATATVRSQELGDFSIVSSPPWESGLVFVMAQDVPVVYAVDADAAAWVEAQYYELMERAVFPHSLLDVAEILVETHAGAHRFAVSLSEGQADSLTVTLDGADLDPAMFLNYFSTLTAARMDEYTDDEIPPQAEPVAVVTMTLTDGSATVVRFYGSDALRRSFLHQEGERPYYTSAGYVNRVVEDLDRLLAGEVVQAWAG